MVFWNKRKEEQRQVIPISDPAVLEFFGLNQSVTGIAVTERTALTLSAVWRAVNIIAGTIASLPLKTYITNSDGTKERIPSFLDNPAGPDSITAYEFKETLLVHMLLHGDAFLLHRKNEAGALVGFRLIHPFNVSVREANIPGGKIFTVTTNNSGQTIELTSKEILHIPAISSDGIRGISPLTIGRDSLGISIAGERSAGRLFANGALIQGIVTPEEDISKDDAEAIKEDIRKRMLGVHNAGDIVITNKKLKFQPWAMSAQDAQFLESRSFQIEEIARWFGISPHLLMHNEKQTSWGTGIEEQNKGVARYTLMPWTSRVEERFATLLPEGQSDEFDFAALLEPDIKDQITLLINQVNAGLLTLNEARRIRNLPPIEGGDTPRGLAGDPTRPQLDDDESLEEPNA